MTRRTGMRPLRIAMIGQKSIPARFGGVETHVENVATRLTGRGHDVWAFCRNRFRQSHNGTPAPEGYVSGPQGESFHGVRLKYRPSINTKHLDAASHALLCAAEAAAFHKFDIVHFHGIGPSAFTGLPRLFGRRVVSTFHALDWRQVKWGDRAKRFLKHGESRGVHGSDGIIAVSRLMQGYIRDTYGIESTYIPNGATMPVARGKGGIARWGLEGNDYILAVGRIIPDREYHTILEAYRELRTDLKLVIVGKETPRSAYSDALEYMADERVVFTGDVFGDALEDLYANARMFILASRVEGLPITVCEAMAHGRACLLSDIPENIEVGGDAGKFFKCGDVNELHATLYDLVDDGATLDDLGRRARARAETLYNWDLVTDAVESFYYQLLER